MKALAFFFSFLFFLFFPGYIFAAAQISVSNLPLTIDQAQEFQVDVNFSCVGCGDSYLRGVFYPSGSSYFGYTQDVSGNWSNAPGGNCTTFFKVSQTDLTPDGTWSGKLKFKPDKDSSFYSGPGEYQFKIGRYTPSCSSPSVWSQESTISVTGPTPTPTQTSVPISTSTPIPTKTPTPTLIPVDIEASSSAVLGDSTRSAEIIEEELTPILKKIEIPKKSQVLGQNNFLQVIITTIGAIFISACGILIFLRRRRGNEIKNIK